jgi:hypothetical protein
VRLKYGVPRETFQVTLSRKGKKIPSCHQEGWRTKSPGWSHARQSSTDVRQYALRILDYVPVFEPHHPDTYALQKPLSRLIVNVSGLVIVPGTVELDCQAFTGAEEIQDVRSNTVLPPKLSAVKLTVLEVFPEYRFSGRELPAQFTAACRQLRKIMKAH